MTSTDRGRIQGLLAEGWRLLELGKPREAALVFGRVVLVEPTLAEALRGLASARAAVGESERRADERLDQARRAVETGDHAAAREALEAVIAEGGDRDGAAALLDRVDARGGRLDPSAIPAAAHEPIAPPAGQGSSRSRQAFAAACTVAFAVLTAGAFASWDRLLWGLTRPPSPHSAEAAVPADVTGGDRALSEARRLMDAGNPAAALAALDRVTPQEPAYPFARQLRRQAERALRGERTPVRPGGRQP